MAKRGLNEISQVSAVTVLSVMVFNSDNRPDRQI